MNTGICMTKGLSEMLKFRSIAALGVHMAIYTVNVLCCFRKFCGINLICIRIYLRNNFAMAMMIHQVRRRSMAMAISCSSVQVSESCKTLHAARAAAAPDGSDMAHFRRPHKNLHTHSHRAPREAASHILLPIATDVNIAWHDEYSRLMLLRLPSSWEGAAWAYAAPRRRSHGGSACHREAQQLPSAWLNPGGRRIRS